MDDKDSIIKKLKTVSKKLPKRWNTSPMKSLPPKSLS